MQSTIQKSAGLKKSIATPNGNQVLLLIVRISLGLALFVKGISFIRNNVTLNRIFEASLVLKEYLWLKTLIPWFHLLGGALIIVGLFTRIIAISQITILICAIIFANSANGLFNGERVWPVILPLLLLLIVFLIYGGGYYSLDRFSFKDKKEW